MSRASRRCSLLLRLAPGGGAVAGVGREAELGRAAEVRTGCAGCATAPGTPPGRLELAGSSAGWEGEVGAVGAGAALPDTGESELTAPAASEALPGAQSMSDGSSREE
jgi:hypothetical protein